MLPPIQPIPQPPAETASADTVQQGRALFAARCAVCHVNLPRSEAPDLRRMGPETHQAFSQIVLGGILKNAGMPPWDGVLTPADVEAIHAYLISLSWDAYNKQQAGPPN
jgi:quinohemoprotein ethanol dehydrogenase